MANPEHLATIRRGIVPWNRWRAENPGATPDLTYAELSGLELSAIAELMFADFPSHRWWKSYPGQYQAKGNFVEVDPTTGDFMGAGGQNPRRFLEINPTTGEVIGEWSNTESAEDVSVTVDATTGEVLNETAIEYPGASMGWRLLTRANLAGANMAGANLKEAILFGADLSGTNLTGANLKKADLQFASLKSSNLKGAILIEANLSSADLNEACLQEANFHAANLESALLKKSTLENAHLAWADLGSADLTETNMTKAYLKFATLSKTILQRAYLAETDLQFAHLLETDLTDAILTGCYVYGISAWGVRLDGAQQSNLVITSRTMEPVITVDNIEMAQFLYLLLNNRKLRHIIDSITSKVVLILGRFVPDRKILLDAIREELRRRDYLPVLFDFDKPASRDLTETIATLAHMARFVIADITEAKSIPQELERIVPELPSVPIQPILESSQHEYPTFEHFRRYPWVLKPVLYKDLESLLGNIHSLVILPAEEKRREG